MLGGTPIGLFEGRPPGAPGQWRQLPNGSAHGIRKYARHRVEAALQQ
jgi:hypothetical protein